MTAPTTPQHLIRRAARWVSEAKSLLITAGAGIGVDSGLPDFRGREGFWRAYPALAKASIDFHQIASPRAFVSNPRLAWGFYGHRLALYRRTVPHIGFSILRDWSGWMTDGAFVFTSNVDGQFHRAGFANVVECHGSIHRLQCSVPCSNETWAATLLDPVVDESTCAFLGELPKCPHCGALARPNVLMFGDYAWVEGPTRAQEHDFRACLSRADPPLVIELGAGTAIPTARAMGEAAGARLIRINPHEAAVSGRNQIGLPMGAKAALEAIDLLI